MSIDIQFTFILFFFFFFQATIYSIDINPNGYLTSGKDGYVKEWTRDLTPTGQAIRIPCLMNDTNGKDLKRGE